MKKLELKHLAGYLLYELKFQMQSDSQEDFGEIIDGLNEEDHKHFLKGAIWEWCGYTGVDIPCGDGEIDGMIFKQKNGLFIGDNGTLKPILRPLSDLKEQKQIAEYFMTFKEHLIRIYPSEQIGLNIASWSHRSVEWLQKWHFDIHGLIDAGLAVDINTLKP